MRALLAGFVLSIAVLACGGSDNPPKCVGATCNCPAGSTCDISTETCGGSCSLDCSNMNECNGSCGDSCSLKCTGSSSCAMTVGKSASVDCSGGATCHITCVGSCSVNCSGGSTCDLQCPGDSSPKSIGAAGNCA